MKVGFTGTREGMTKPQADAVANQLLGLGATEFHHGDCMGADEEFHGIACTWRAVHSFASDFSHTPKPRIVTHPSEDESFRAFCEPDEYREPKGYLERNRDIVDETDILIAAPKGFEEERRSGTWATVRWARGTGKAVYIVWPDGKVTHEQRGVDVLPVQSHERRQMA